MKAHSAPSFGHVVLFLAGSDFYPLPQELRDDVSKIRKNVLVLATHGLRSMRGGCRELDFGML
jgi:hypothetical protein